MTTVPTIAFREEQPSIISYGDFKVTSTGTINIGQPVEVDTSQGTAGIDTTDQNRVWVKRYASANSTNLCLGIMTKQVLPRGHAATLRGGLGGYLRDAALIQWGLMPMFNVGNLDVSIGDRVAPAYLGADATVAGFKKWESGEKSLGYCHEFNIPKYASGTDTVHLGKIFITLAISTGAATAMADMAEITLGTSGGGLSLASGHVLQYDGTVWRNQELLIMEALDLELVGKAQYDALLYDGADSFDVTSLSIDTHLTDTDLTGAVTNNAIVYNSVSGNWEDVALSIDTHLTDTVVTAATEGDILKHDGSNWVDVQLTVANIKDIDIAGPSQYDILVMDGAGKWNDIPLVLNLVSDITIAAASEFDILVCNGANQWHDIPLTINLASDVTIAAASQYDILVCDGANQWHDIPLVLNLASDVTETSIASGHALIWNGSAYVNCVCLTEFVSSADGGTNHEATLTHTPLIISSVFSSAVGQGSGAQYTYDATATVPTLTYNWALAVLSTNKISDHDTHLMVTYWYAKA